MEKENAHLKKLVADLSLDCSVSELMGENRMKK
jgi:hypothetical protein